MSSSRAVTVSAPSVAQQNPGVRLINLVVDPAAAFRGIADNPRWALAFAAAVALRFGSLFIFYRPSLTPLKLLAGVVFQVTTITPALLLGSLVVTLAAKAWRVDVRWTPTFSIVAHVYVAYTLATIAVASIAGAVLPESTEIDLRNPPFTNVSWLIGDSGDVIVHRMLAELDVRSVYALVLLWLGLRSASADATRSPVAYVIATVAAIRIVGVVGMQLMR